MFDGPANSSAPMTDLQGITVVAVEQAVAAPYATGRLARAGARVIKVERPEGDFARGYDRLAAGQSAYFVWLNGGKESVVLDLREPSAKSTLAAMIAGADVLVQNLMPGAIARQGFAIEDLRERHPSLVCCSISGYGERGPYRDQKAYDLLIQAESGLAAVNGIGDEPARVGVSVCDIAAGMAAHAAILQALFARERDPERRGRAIEVSLFGAMADWMNVPHLQHRYGGVTPRRLGLAHPTIAPYGAYRCADGKALLISIQNEREWRRLCAEVLGQPDLPEREGFRDNSERMANRDAVDAAVATVFARETREALIGRLAAAGIAYGRLSDLDDLAAHPQRETVAVATEGGTIDLLAPAASVRDVDLRDGGTTLRVPALDEHGDRLRAEFAPLRAA